MANFEPCIRGIKDDGYANVYIRVISKRKIGYLKTDYVIHKSKLSNKRIKDRFILQMVFAMIDKFVEKLNRHPLTEIDDIMDYLRRGEQISFTDHCNRFILNMSAEGREKPSDNYRTAYNSLCKFIGEDKIYFSDISSRLITKWIESLSNTARAKQAYPACIKVMFNQGLLEYNDYDNNILIISNDPFKNVKIPKSEVPPKRAIPIEDIVKIFNFKDSGQRTQLAVDVSILIFYLCGINTVDLYLLDKSNLVDGKLRYNRRKTTSKRSFDKAYFEIKVPKKVEYLFKKHQGTDKLFNFSEKYSSFDIFSTAVNKGLKQVCNALQIDNVTCYGFRHSWATIAQNNCGASTELVGFCLNHASAHKVTEGYIKKDFSKINVLNKKVCKKVEAELHSPAPMAHLKNE
jgi:integrase